MKYSFKCHLCLFKFQEWVTNIEIMILIIIVYMFTFINDRLFHGVGSGFLASRSWITRTLKVKILVYISKQSGMKFDYNTIFTILTNKALLNRNPEVNICFKYVLFHKGICPFWGFWGG